MPITFSEKDLNKAIVELRGEIEKLSKADAAPASSEKSPEPSSPGDESPAEDTTASTDTSASSSAPPSGDETASPASPSPSASPSPDGSAPADPAAAQGPVDPAALQAEYAQLAPEELMAHEKALSAAMMSLGISPAGAPPAPAPVPDASPMGNAPPPAGPSASPAAPPAPASASPMPPMGKAEERLENVAPEKGGTGKQGLPAIQPEKGGTGEQRLASVEPTKKAEHALVSANPKGPMSGPRSGEHVVNKNEQEVNDLKKALADSKKAMQDQTEAVAKIVGALTGQPLSKAITGISQISKPGTETQTKTLSKSEIKAIITEKSMNPSLSKSDKEKIISYTLNPDSVSFESIKHLLK